MYDFKTQVFERVVPCCVLANSFCAIKLLDCIVAIYAAETWTYKKEDIRRLEAFEMWV